MKSPLAFLLGLGIGIGATVAFGLGFFSPAVGESEWKTLRDRAQAQSLEIERQQKEIEAGARTIQRLQAAVAIPPSAAPTVTPAPKPKNPMAGLADLMDNPAMRKVMAAQQVQMIEQNYADLIDRFHFTPEERAQFVRLLAAKQQIQMDMGMKMLKLAPEERRALAEEMKAAQDDADEAIKEFFNDEKDFAAYTEYTREQTQNYAIKSLRPAMKFAGQPLTAEQEKSLQEIIRAGRKKVAPTREEDDPAPSADASARILENQALRNEQILADAAGILSPGQLEVLRKSQASQLQMMKAGFEMSRSMLGE